MTNEKYEGKKTDSVMCMLRWGQLMVCVVFVFHFFSRVRVERGLGWVCMHVAPCFFVCLFPDLFAASLRSRTQSTHHTAKAHDRV